MEDYFIKFHTIGVKKNNKKPIIWNKGDREFKEDIRAYAKGLEMKKLAYLSRDQNWVREWLMSLLGKSFSKIVNKSKLGRKLGCSINLHQADITTAKLAGRKSGRGKN